MKSAIARSSTGGHPADRILAIVNKLQEDAHDREALVRLQTREDVTAELQSKLNEAQASIAQLHEQARVAASQWQEERARFEEQIAALNARSQSPHNDQPDRASSTEAVAMVEGEMTRVQSLIDEIDKKLADPALELSAEMRLRRERLELETYLKGLRYSQSRP